MRLVSVDSSDNDTDFIRPYYSLPERSLQLEKFITLLPRKIILQKTDRVPCFCLYGCRICARGGGGSVA